MIHHSAKMHFHIQEVAVMVSVPVIVKTSIMLRSGNRNRCHYGTPNATKISCLCRLDHSSSSRPCRNVWIEVWSLERILAFSRTFQGSIPGTISRTFQGSILGTILKRFCHRNFGPGNFGPGDQNFLWKMWSASWKIGPGWRRSF